MRVYLLLAAIVVVAFLGLVLGATAYKPIKAHSAFYDDCIVDNDLAVLELNIAATRNPIVREAMLAERESMLKGMSR